MINSLNSAGVVAAPLEAGGEEGTNVQGRGQVPIQEKEAEPEGATAEKVSQGLATASSLAGSAAAVATISGAGAPAAAPLAAVAGVAAVGSAVAGTVAKAQKGEAQATANEGSRAVTGAVETHGDIEKAVALARKTQGQTSVLPTPTPAATTPTVVS